MGYVPSMEGQSQMAMKMTIEYDIQGRETFMPYQISSDKDIVDEIKRINEQSLRRDGVFSEIQHRVVIRDDVDNPSAKVVSSGKRFLKEVKDGD